MCGRIACALGNSDLCCATSYRKPGSVEYCKPALDPSMKDVVPNFNIPPTSMVPVLVSTTNENFKQYRPTERILVAMRFGIIPSNSVNFQGMPKEKSYALETHLCRIERMGISKLYGPLFDKGLRCAIPCVGYYEWQSTKSTVNKQPFFFYNKENSKDDLLNIYGKFDPEHGWSGVKVLYLAGIYSVFTDAKGNNTYSFAIITKESELDFQFVHHRMPVILQNEEDIRAWLSNNSCKLEALNPVMSLVSNVTVHPVSKFVNNAKNNSIKCVEPFELNKPTSKLMQQWLETSPKESAASTSDENKNRISIKKWIEKQGTNDSKENLKSEKSPKKTSYNKSENSATKKKRSVLDNWLSSAEKKPKTE